MSDLAKQEAQRKLAAAEKASAMALQGKQAALEALMGSVSVNGFGIVRDPYAARRQLQAAQDCIQQALTVLSCVEWPTDAEYDLF